MSNCKINTSFDYDSPADFLKSQWQTKHKSTNYLIYRWTIATFYMFSVVVSLTTSTMRSELSFYFIYLTHWNLIFTMVSTVLLAVLVTLHQSDKLILTDKMSRELKIFWFLSTTSTMYAFLVSMIYWMILYKSQVNIIDLNNVLIHATNSLVLILDMAIVKYKGRFGLFLYSFCCGFLFFLFSWLYPFLGGRNRQGQIVVDRHDFEIINRVLIIFRRGQDFIYPILDWKRMPLMAFLAGVGVTVAGVIVHSLIIGIHHIRAAVHKKYFIKRTEKSMEKSDIFILA